MRFFLFLITLIFPCWVAADPISQQKPEDELGQLTKIFSKKDIVESDVFYPIASKYVKTDFLDVRNLPIDGVVIGKLKRGENVLIYDRQGTWERISEQNQSQRWVSSHSLCSGVNCYLNNKNNIVMHLNTNKRITKKTINKSKASSKSLTAPVNYSNDVSCPCSGVNDCIGRRGGHFCYTSGGNKRYR